MKNLNSFLVFLSLYHSRYVHGDLPIISVYASYFTKVLVFNVWLQKEKQDGKGKGYRPLNSLEVTLARVKGTSNDWGCAVTMVIALGLNLCGSIVCDKSTDP